MRSHGSIGQADLGGNHSYKFIYSRVFAADPYGCNFLILLVGAVRFELTTPCAQGSFRPPSKMPYFQLLTFQADGANLLQLVAPCGTRRLSPATFLSTACNQRCHEAGDRSQCRRRRRRQGRSPGTPASGTMAMLFLSRNSNAAITHRGFGILNVLRITVALRVAPPRFRAPSATPRP